MEVKKYLDLITSENVKPNFLSITDHLLNLIKNSTDVLEDFWNYFNLDTATGAQLDIIGQYLNITRNMPANITDLPSVLDDDTFRILLKSCVLQYRWDGTIDGLYKIITYLYPDTVLWIDDRGNMSYQVSVLANSFDPYVPELFINGYILPKPAGIKVNYLIIESKVFTWDTEEQYKSGWDNSSWFN